LTYLLDNNDKKLLARTDSNQKISYKIKIEEIFICNVDYTFK